MSQVSGSDSFGWITIKGCLLPFIIRNTNDKQIRYISARIVETECLATYMTYLNTNIYTYVSVKGYFITVPEAKLLNDIYIKDNNQIYGDGLLQAEKDFIVCVEDVIEFCTFLEFCNTKIISNDRSIHNERCGFIKLNSESVMPYCIKNDQKYIPLFYFEGVVENLSCRSIKIEDWDLAYLKFCCKIQGIRHNFFASDSCLVINLEEIKNYFSPDTTYEDYWPNKVIKTDLLNIKKSTKKNHQPQGVWIRVPPPIQENILQTSHISTSKNMQPPRSSPLSMPSLSMEPQRWPSPSIPLPSMQPLRSPSPGVPLPSIQPLRSPLPGVPFLSMQPLRSPTPDVPLPSTQPLRSPPPGVPLPSIQPLRSPLPGVPFLSMQPLRSPPPDVPLPSTQPLRSPPPGVPFLSMQPLRSPPPGVPLPSTQPLRSPPPGVPLPSVSLPSIPSPSIPSAIMLLPNDVYQYLWPVNKIVNSTIVQQCHSSMNNLSYLLPIVQVCSTTTPVAHFNAVSTCQSMTSSNPITNINLTSSHSNQIGQFTEVIDLTSPPLSPAPLQIPQDNAQNNIGCKLVPIPERLWGQETQDNAAYKIQKATLQGNAIIGINAKAFIYSDLMVTLDTLVQTLLIECSIQRCAHILYNNLHITLYSPNMEQMKVLHENGLLGSLEPDIIPMAMLKDLTHVLIQLKHLVSKQDEQTQPTETAVVSKRQHMD